MSEHDDKLPLAKTVETPRAAWAGESTVLQQQIATTPADVTAVPSRPRRAPSDAGADSRYGFMSIHAVGGFGQVWLARDHQFDRDVAIKELLTQNSRDGKTVERFLREARLTGQLEHPGIVPVYELGSREGTPFYAMRFVRGRTLSDAARSFHCNRLHGRAG